MGPVIMSYSDLHSADSIFLPGSSPIYLWLQITYIYDFIYIFNISRLYCHFRETRMVTEFSDLPKKSHDQAKTKIPNFQTSSALGYNLLFSLSISESLWDP